MSIIYMGVLNEKKGLDLISKLKRLDGALSYDGDASCQVVFQLRNGKTLRFGVTDRDVSAVPGLWIDQYPGLFNEL